MTKIWVYGSLRQNQENHDLYLTNATFLSIAYAKGSLYTLKDLSYPAFLNDDQRLICGELYEVDDVTLQRCDDLEDYFPDAYQKSEYLRQKIILYDHQGQIISDAEAYIYNIANHDNAALDHLIQEDDFVLFLQNQH